MLQVEVDQRYTAVQVLDHPWVNVSPVLLVLTRVAIVHSGAT